MSKQNVNNIAIIVAAGSGSRYGGSVPKQYLKIEGKQILRMAVEQFTSHPDIDATIVAVHNDAVHMYESAVSGLDVLPYVVGGSTRQQSVYNALEKIQVYSPKKVLIHDAARVFVSDKTISSLISELDANKASIAAVRVRDTIKHMESGKIKKTVPRKDVFLAQTPQAFEYNTILGLHKKYSDKDFTDDASLCEQDGIAVSIVESSMLNFKITTKEDFDLAEKILSK